MKRCWVLLPVIALFLALVSNRPAIASLAGPALLILIQDLTPPGEAPSVLKDLAADHPDTAIKRRIEQELKNWGEQN